MQMPSMWNFYNCLTFGFFCILQGKEYVFVANSDNLGAVVDLSILNQKLCLQIKTRILVINNESVGETLLINKTKYYLVSCMSP